MNREDNTTFFPSETSRGRGLIPDPSISDICFGSRTLVIKRRNPITFNIFRIAPFYFGPFDNCILTDYEGWQLSVLADIYSGNWVLLITVQNFILKDKILK